MVIVLCILQEKNVEDEINHKMATKSLLATRDKIIGARFNMEWLNIYTIGMMCRLSNSKTQVQREFGIFTQTHIKQLGNT